MKQQYYLGLDMGTNSVGWAVTDENYQLLRAKGKDLWGVRMFEIALSSADRRAHRVSRRRLQRQRVKIGLLKDYFHDAVCREDPSFFIRLENSKYHLEDKDEIVRQKYAVFHDKDYSDTDYYREYPTIFHLRKALMEDICDHEHRYARFVFLALLNMFKHRGHFLVANLSDDGNLGSVALLYQDFRDIVKEKTDLDFPESFDMQAFQDTLSNRDYSRTQKVEMLGELLGIGKSDKQKYEFIKAFCGLTVDPAKLFPERADKGAEGKTVKFSFTDAGYDEKYPDILVSAGAENEELLETMKQLHDAAQLAGIRNGFDSLSEARFDSYEKHKKDLALLKAVVRRLFTAEKYDELFRSEKDGSYSAYVNSFNAGTKKRRNMKARKADDLYETLKKLMKGKESDSDVQYIMDEISKGTFLPKQLTSENGVIPNQVHVSEMKRILANAEKYLPFLLEVNEKGYTVSEQIIQLFSFQVPYYVGPVTENSQKNQGNGWVIRKSEGDVLPWNIEDKIDLKATSEKFIERLVRKCSYIDGETVLPKGSLLYERFAVLNEINNIRIRGEKISVGLKQDIYKDLFEKGRKVTRKALEKYLKSVKGVLEDPADLTGIDIAVNNSLNTYGKFNSLFGDKIREDEYQALAEDIVYWCTVYGDSRKFLKEKLEERYHGKLTEDQVKRILGFRFKDWGRLSRAFLELPGCDPSTGEIVPLIRMMWDTNLNMMELINSPEYGFRDELGRRAGASTKVLKEFRSEDLKEYYFSAPVRRMIWQTLQIIQELEHVLGGAPEKIFIEMTRQPDDRKQRTVSRKNKFTDLYNNVKDETAAWRREWKELVQKEDESGRLRSKKMYLYLTQMGKCMYTGRTIDLKDLFDDNLYDIDHIYPREFVKDDNIDNNLVLVYKPENNRKSDDYPLDHVVFQKQHDFWKRLRDLGFINAEKYLRLTCRTPLSDEQKAEFIARQLVETSQGTKGVADLLKQLLPENSTVIYAKASNVSRFRQQNGFLKSRSVNDFHHAQDAYLNIVVGNVYYTKFTQNPLNFIKNEYTSDPKKNHYNLDRMFKWDVMRGGKTAWVAAKKGNEGSIATVKRVLSRNTPLITRLCYEGHGGILNQTIYSAEKATKELYVPLKSSDPKLQDVTKYGGYTNASTAYFFLAEHKQKKAFVRTLETVPIYMAGKIQTREDLEVYCRDVLKLEAPRICVEKILLQSLVSINGYDVYLSGKTDNRVILKNAVQLCLGQEWINYIHEIEHAVESSNYKDVTAEDNMRLYEELVLKHREGVYARRPNYMGDKLQSHTEDFRKLGIEDQCRTILEILKLSVVGTGEANLTLIGEKASSGKIRHSKKLSSSEEIWQINRSVTGIYENRSDLMKV